MSYYVYMRREGERKGSKRQIFTTHRCSGTASRNTGLIMKKPAIRFAGHVKKKTNFWYRPNPPISSSMSSNLIVSQCFDTDHYIIGKHRKKCFLTLFPMSLFSYTVQLLQALYNYETFIYGTFSRSNYYKGFMS